MGKNTKLTREELLARKRAAEQVRRDKIKLNPEAHAQYKEREKLRYQKRKEQKKLVQINDMTPRQRRNQRKRWKINSKNFRDRQRNKLQLIQRLAENSPPDTDSDDNDAAAVVIADNPPSSPRTADRRPSTRSVSVKTPTQLIVPGTSRQRDSSRNEELSIIKRRLRYNFSKKLLWYKKQLADLRKRNEMLRKRILRYKKREHVDSVSPKTKVEILLSDPNKRDDVKKTLVFAETIKENLTTNYENLKSHKQKQIFKENIEPACNTLKKYRMLNHLKPKIVRKLKSKKGVSDTNTRIKEDIKIFFESDDNSRMAAGKKECITRNKEKKQKRFLLDSLINLYKKFLQTHDGYTISYSLFCKNKPYWVVAPAEKDKETCMCKLHENITLLAQALWKNKILYEKSSSEILSTTVCDIYNLNCLERKCLECMNKVPTIGEFDNSTEIQYKMWEAGTKEINTRRGIKEIRIVIKKISKAPPKAVINLLMNDLPKFYAHCANITNQYKCTTTLKKQLELNEVVLHMDFSENYSTKYNTEIQSVHFGGSRNQISLHTSVIYIPGLEPQSFCTYSDCLRHDATAVWGHIVPILKFIEVTAPNTDTLHIITDSTCSQYRNKTMNYIISKLYWYIKNLKCISWNYTEAGHGKGAPDGVGATVKRTADQLVRYGKDIPDIDTFATEIKKAVKNIVLKYVSEYDIYEKEYFLPSTSLKPFRGMLKVHQIVWDKNNQHTIALRRQSCVLEPCKTKAIVCAHSKHLGFYDLPKLGTSPEALTLDLSSDVVPLHRSRNFIASHNNNLPIELRDKDTECGRDIILESMIRADLQSSDTIQHFENPLDGPQLEISENQSVVSVPAVDMKLMEEALQQVSPDLPEISISQHDFCLEDTHLDTKEPKSPSILTPDIEVPQDVTVTSKKENFKTGSWVIISYRVKKGAKYFIGQIINTNDDCTFDVKFLRKHKGTSDVFTWPENEDEDCVSKDSIIKMLNEPNINRRGQLIFNDIRDFVLE